MGPSAVASLQARSQYPGWRHADPLQYAGLSRRSPSCRPLATSQPGALLNTAALIATYSEMMPGSNDGYVIRPAGAHDAQLIALQRASMFRDVGSVSTEESELLRKASEPWLSSRLTNGDYIGWLVENRRIVVAGGGILVRELGPVPGCYRVGRWGHIANLYTEPAHRRRGLARRLMKTILDWCTVHGVDHVTLAASDEGRPLLSPSASNPLRA
jgi:GNAT superfamily N-acetyltransferase